LEAIVSLLGVCPTNTPQPYRLPLSLIPLAPFGFRS
jgi:hypothetical protein